MLVRAPNWVGDVVMATPALRALRARYPRSRITVLGRSNGLRLLEGLSSFDEGLPAGKTLWADVRTIRSYRPDLAVLFRTPTRARSPRSSPSCRGGSATT